MSQPESATADAQAGGPSDGTPTTGQEPLAKLAERYGLRRAIARPSLPVYLRQLWERRHFVMTYATSRNVSKYSNSALGQLWQVLTPLLNAAIYWLMFGLILGASKDIENYPAFLITGMFVFTYTQRAVSGGAKSISGNLSMIRALHFPRAALPLAYTIQEFQQLLISMGVLFALVLVTGEPLTWFWLLVPVALVLQTMFNVGASLVLARVGATARDLNQLLPFIMRTWLYASGVFFAIGDKVVNSAGLPQWVADVMYFNPAAAYIELMRNLLIESHSTRPYIWSVCVFWAVFALIGGFWYFWRAEEKYGRG
ncbi:ABC transporter permease [Planomonospora venezuelensis]|uniref:Transport permease protein n=1 Tax=Planomonospora venezuelensis TaxID=1999 RepID=A0A841DA95_PLAVE|nr:ABC transporter permease [Planomonospora venezuelensis]MBB5965238.1 teichoic acid transport system permease protein [Planomonospora venezuelensis]GIN00528.1 transport permease protein [Planomonospora venezuelensis]